MHNHNKPCHEQARPGYRCFVLLETVEATIIVIYHTTYDKVSCLNSIYKIVEMMLYIVPHEKPVRTFFTGSIGTCVQLQQTAYRHWHGLFSGSNYTCDHK